MNMTFVLSDSCMVVQEDNSCMDTSPWQKHYRTYESLAGAVVRKGVGCVRETFLRSAVGEDQAPRCHVGSISKGHGDG